MTLEDRIQILREEATLRVQKSRPRYSRNVEEPLPPEFLAARDAFGQRWAALKTEGLDAGFLCEDYDGEVYLDGAATRTLEETEFTETGAEWLARIEPYVEDEILRLLRSN